MTTSRRRFLRSLGASAAAGIALQSPLTEVLRAATFEPSRPWEGYGLIRLNSNENAYGPSARVAEVTRSSIGSANRYPRMEYKGLVEQIAGTHKVKPEQVLLGCGSTELLRVAALAFLDSSKQLIQASPTFEALEHYARAGGAEIIPRTSPSALRW